MIHQLVKVNQVQIQAVIGDKSPKEKPGSASGDFQDPLPLQQAGASLLPREPAFTPDMEQVYGANGFCALNSLNSLPVGPYVGSGLFLAP